MGCKRVNNKYTVEIGENTRIIHMERVLLSICVLKTQTMTVQVGSEGNEGIYNDLLNDRGPSSSDAVALASLK